jgi:hypothetical protein
MNIFAQPGPTGFSGPVGTSIAKVLDPMRPGDRAYLLQKWEREARLANNLEALRELRAYRRLKGL